MSAAKKDQYEVPGGHPECQEGQSRLPQRKMSLPVWSATLAKTGVKVSLECHKGEPAAPCPQGWPGPQTSGECRGEHKGRRGWPLGAGGGYREGKIDFRSQSQRNVNKGVKRLN